MIISGVAETLRTICEPPAIVETAAVSSANNDNLSVGKSIVSSVDLCSGKAAASSGDKVGEAEEEVDGWSDVEENEMLQMAEKGDVGV